MSVYLQPKEDKLIFLPHSGTLMLNLQTTQIWIAVARYKSGHEGEGDEVIGYGLRLEGDTSPNAYLVSYDLIMNNFNIISNGEILPAMSTKTALDAMVRDA